MSFGRDIGNEVARQTFWIIAKIVAVAVVVGFALGVLLG